MQPPLFIFLGLILVALVVALVWRISSNRTELPCPSWLAWLVELDNPLLKENRARTIMAHLDLRPGMQVLDFGCGPGRLTIPIAKHIGEAGMVTAFDIQPAMLARVREKASRENLRNIQFVQGAAGEGELGNDVYDRALLVTVLGEIPDKSVLMQEIFDALKPGGWLAVTEAIADPHFQRRSTVVELAEAAGFQEKGFFGSKISFTMLFEKP